jgi:hypothetical protein
MRKRTSSWDVQSRDRTLLRFYRERFSSFENYVAHENSHDVSRSLTDLRISNLQSIDWDRRRNDKRSNQKRRDWTLLWALSKFLILNEKEEKSIVWLMLRWRWIESSFEMRICLLRWTSFQKNLLIASLSRWWICFSNMINYRWLKNVKIWSSLWRRSIWWKWLRFSWKQSILWLNSFEWSIKLSSIMCFITRFRL